MQSVLKRALELAPECGTLGELRDRLSSEGYDHLNAHLGGLGIKRQLRALFNQGRGGTPTGPRGDRAMNPKTGER